VLFVLILSSPFDLVLPSVRLKEEVIAFGLLDGFFGWFSSSMTNRPSFVRIADVFRHLLLSFLESVRDLFWSRLLCSSFINGLCNVRKCSRYIFFSMISKLFMLLIPLMDVLLTKSGIDCT